jgi:hypothetical protein
MTVKNRIEDFIRLEKNKLENQFNTLVEHVSGQSIVSSIIIGLKNQMMKMVVLLYEAVEWINELEDELHEEKHRREDR